VKGVSGICSQHRALLAPSWPGLTRASLAFADARVNPGHDDKREAALAKAVQS